MPVEVRSSSATYGYHGSSWGWSSERPTSVHMTLQVARDTLPPGWAVARIDRVGAVRLGLKLISSERHTGRFPTKYIRSANITPTGIDVSNVLEMDFNPSERRVYGLVDGDVLLTEASGSASQVGRSAVWRNQLQGCCFQNTVIRFRPHAATPEFAHAVFRYYAATGVFAETARGVGIQHLTEVRFSALPFPLPPLAEQRRIALDVDERTESLKNAASALHAALSRIDEQNREILSAAVGGALVEQEAVLAAREGRAYEPAADTLARVLLAAGRPSLFDEANQPSTALRELPQGWTWSRIKDLGEVRLGKQLTPKEERGRNQVPYLRVANVLENSLDLSDVKTMHFSENEHDDYQLRDGDVLLNEGQSIELVGRPAIFRGELADVCFQNTLIRFRASEAVIPDFALLVFRHFLHSGEFQSIARRSTNIAHLGRERFAELSFPLPPVAEQIRIVTEAHRRLQASTVQRASVRASLDRLPELERELLTAAATGSLVQRDPSDEPADTLLERLGPPPLDEIPVDSEAVGAREVRVTKRSQRSGSPTKTTLRDVLVEAGRPLRVPELFSMAAYDRDSTEDVERFYLRIREELGRSIRVAGGSGEETLLEANQDEA
jgi:restriction endonuclease S subunit